MRENARDAPPHTTLISPVAAAAGAATVMGAEGAAFPGTVAGGFFCNCTVAWGMPALVGAPGGTFAVSFFASALSGAGAMTGAAGVAGLMAAGAVTGFAGATGAGATGAAAAGAGATGGLIPTGGAGGATGGLGGTTPAGAGGLGTAGGGTERGGFGAATGGGATGAAAAGAGAMPGGFGGGGGAERLPGGLGGTTGIPGFCTGLGGRLMVAVSRAPGVVCPSRRGGRTMRTVSFLGSSAISDFG